MKISLRRVLAAATLSVIVFAITAGIWAHRKHPFSAYPNVKRKVLQEIASIATSN